MTVSCTEVSSEFSDVPLDGENSKVNTFNLKNIKALRQSFDL